MTPDDNSWIITTEVNLVPEPDDDVDGLDPVRAQIITVPDYSPSSLIGEDPSEPTYPDLILHGGEVISLDYKTKGFRVNRLEDDAEYFIYLSLRSQGLSPTEDQIFLLRAMLLEVVPVPVLGSPPHDWQPLATLLSSGGGASVATAVATVQGTPAPATFIISFATMTVLINIFSPVTWALGHGVAHKINQFFGTPETPQ